MYIRLKDQMYIRVSLFWFILFFAVKTTEKTTENHSIGNVDSSSSINIFHVEDRSSRNKLFQVDESNTKQDILQKNSNK